MQDQSQYLVSDVLRINDQMSMAHGLEMRMPFLDQTLLAFLKDIPDTKQLQKGPKWLLRALLNRRQGQAYSQRKKEGFGVPADYWFRQAQGQALLAPLQKRSHPLFDHINHEAYQQLYQAHQSQKQNHGPFLWSMLVLGNWLNKHA